MTLSETAHRRLLWAGVVAVILALRVGCVLYERSRPFPQKAVVERRIEPDHLVVAPKSNVEDLASARQLVGKTLWVKLGYATGYFLDKPQVSEKQRQVLYFEPLDSLAVEAVLERLIAGEPGNKEVLVRFQRDGRGWLTAVGTFDAQARHYDMRLDDLFYIRNPRELYAHWGESTWKKIEKHLLEPGMTQAQVVFSMGFGRLVTTEAGGIHLYEFTRKPGGSPGKTRVRFLEGRVKEFEVLK